MNKQEAKEQLKGYLRSYVERVTKKSKSSKYICPLCGSGNGHNQTGAFSIKDDISWKCFSCNRGGDILDLYGAINGATDYNQQLAGLSHIYGINIESSRSNAFDDFSQEYQKQEENEQYTDNIMKTNKYPNRQQPQQTNYTDFFLQAHSHITETDYPQKRGLSETTIERFKLGYVPEWKHPKVTPNIPASPRLIIPTSPTSYLARDVREEVTAEQEKYIKSKVGSMNFFNLEALQKSKGPIFVTEGEIDALSIIEVGGEAIALGSTTKNKAFIEQCKINKPSKLIIIALDNDESGEKAARELEEGLRSLKIPCSICNIAGEYKDANEALQRDKEALRIAVEKAERAKRDSYLKTSAAYFIESFVDEISGIVNTPYIPTGFSKLDNILDGGLYEGLYIIGAISSLGKTTIITQIADQIAQAGHDVLIFSLEMARTEIMAKSISRHTIQIALNNGGDTKNAKTTRGITASTRYKDYSDAELEIIHEAIRTYGQYANHVYISEGVGNIGTEQVRQKVAEHIFYTDRTPVVIIDYLQILAPYNERATDKQNTDKAVMELKRISRDYKTPVIGISSFNRASYKESVTMEAFKESGAIEYSSDVLIGLQLKGAGEKNFDPNESKREHPRKIELVILKNRNGCTGVTVNFNFYPPFNFFKEV